MPTGARPQDRYVMSLRAPERDAVESGRERKLRQRGTRRAVTIHSRADCSAPLQDCHVSRFFDVWCRSNPAKRLATTARGNEALRHRRISHHWPCDEPSAAWPDTVDLGMAEPRRSSRSERRRVAIAPYPPPVLIDGNPPPSSTRRSPRTRWELRIAKRATWPVMPIDGGPRCHARSNVR